MKPQSAIKKGKAFENMIAQDIEEAGLGMARREIGSGSGKKKGDIFANIPFLLEAKNQKILKPLAWIDQAKEQARVGNSDRDKWGLVFRDPRTPMSNPSVYITIDWYEFLKLLKKNREPLIKEPDRQMKFKIQRFVEAGQSLLKEFK